MPDALVRGLRPEETGAFAALVARSRDEGALDASSEPRGEWLVRLAARRPDELVVAVAGGALVGFVAPDAKVVVVQPSHRRAGIGRALVEAGLDLERRRGQADLILGALPGDVGGRAFLEATGFTFHSTLWDMELPSAVAVAPDSWPAGVRVRSIDGGRDLPAWVDLLNAAFAGHATPMRMELADVESDWGRPLPASEDDILVAAAADGGLVGFCATQPRRRADGGLEPAAEIWTIGVHPGFQRRGLGRQLLRWGVRYLRGLGVETVTLSVNGIHAGALRLYESEGFGRRSTRDRWARSVAATAPGSPATG